MFRLLALLALLAPKAVAEKHYKGVGHDGGGERTNERKLSTNGLRPKVEEPSGQHGHLRVPCSQFVDGASTADEDRYVCAKEVPNKLFNANANSAGLFNKHAYPTMFQCSPAAVPEEVHSDPTQMLDAHLYEREAKKSNRPPCPSDKEFVIASIPHVPAPTCACKVHIGCPLPELDSIVCETVKPAALFGIVESRVECSPTNEDDSAVGGEDGGAENYHRCRSDSTPCVFAEMTPCVLDPISLESCVCETFPEGEVPTPGTVVCAKVDFASGALPAHGNGRIRCFSKNADYRGDDGGALTWSGCRSDMTPCKYTTPNGCNSKEICSGDSDCRCPGERCWCSGDPNCVTICQDIALFGALDK